MYAEERQQRIVEHVHAHGRASVADLATVFDVTSETIRRDLAVLDHCGALRKVHGGAIASDVVDLPETGVTERESVNAPAKQTIAAAAIAALGLTPGTSILLDAGTTPAAFARLLPVGLDLTVITDSVLIAAALAPHTDITVHILGGIVRGVTQAAVGSAATDQLSRLRADIAVLGANGLSREHGLSTPDPAEAAVKRAMVHSARRVVALVDSSKIGQEHLVSFADLSDIDLLVTDQALPAAFASQLTDTGTEVLVA